MKTFNRFILIILFVITYTQISGNNSFINLSDKKQNNNPGDTISKSIQVSFVPYFGTQGYISDTSSVDISVNLLAGVVSNVNKCELGGLVNIDRNSVKNCQLAGLGNIVLGKSEGFQAAGTFNFTKSADGIQIAGIINSSGTSKGMQIAGINNHASHGICSQMAGMVNTSLDSAIFQISGIANYAPVVRQFQISGLINVSKETPFQITGLVNHCEQANKFQIAGLVNNTASITGFQIAGLVNNAPGLRSSQITGLVNNCNSFEGVQIAGLVNRTSFFKGAQIGLINISDSCKGIPIGLFNFVRSGYHQFEISGDEFFYTNIAFRSGLHKLHSILIAGFKPDNFNEPLWTYGVGLGSLISLSQITSLGMDLTFQNVVKGSHVNNNYLCKLGTGIDLKISHQSSLYFGVTYNFLATYKDQPKFNEIYSSIAPYHFTNTENNHFNFKSWAGFKVAFRF